MQHALLLAEKAALEGEVPVGAVVIGPENQLLGAGYNQVLQRQDPTAHAEIIAIKAATKACNNYRLDNAILYVTLEPCCMCAGAIIHARIKRLVFGARDFKVGAAGSVYQLLKGFPQNHAVTVDEAVLHEECSKLLMDFFANKR